MITTYSNNEFNKSLLEYVSSHVVYKKHKADRREKIKTLLI